MTEETDTRLPEADAETHAFFIAWLDEFAGYVRDVDYASARPLFHPDVLAFGTLNDVIAGLDSWVATQWDNVWPRTEGFSFVLKAARVLVSTDRTVAVVLAPWTSTGFDRSKVPFERPGRATMVFHRHGDRWTCVHSHMSLNRGVPQASFGDRPVKAR